MDGDWYYRYPGPGGPGFESLLQPLSACSPEQARDGGAPVMTQPARAVSRCPGEVEGDGPGR
jgi:hypothetical protein